MSAQRTPSPHACGRTFSRAPTRPGTDLLPTLGPPSPSQRGAVHASQLPACRPQTREQKVRDSERRLRQVLALTPDASTKDKGAIINELRDLCVFYHSECIHLQTQSTHLEQRLDASEGARKQMDDQLDDFDQTLKAYKNLNISLNPTTEDIMALEQSVRDIEDDIRRCSLPGDDRRPTGSCPSPSFSRPPSRAFGDPQSPVRPPTSPMAMTPTTASGDTGSAHSRVQQLVELRFRRLEDLIFILKRRLNVYEQNASLADAVERCGGVEALLMENERLKKEVEILRHNETRHDASTLLSRSRLDTYGAPALQALVRALQCELSAARALVAQYDLDHNPALKLEPHIPPALLPSATQSSLDSMRGELTDRILTDRMENSSRAPETQRSRLSMVSPRSPPPTPPQSSLAPIPSARDDTQGQAPLSTRTRTPRTFRSDAPAEVTTARSGVDPDFASARSAPRSARPQQPSQGGAQQPAQTADEALDSTTITPLSLSALVGRANFLESENVRLRQTLDRVLGDETNARRVTGIDNELVAMLDGRSKPAGGKAYKLLEVQKINGHLLSELKAYSEELAHKDEALSLMTGIVAEISAQRMKSDAKSLQLSTRILYLLQRNKSLLHQARTNEEKYHTLSLLAVGLAERAADASYELQYRPPFLPGEQRAPSPAPIVAPQPDPQPQPRQRSLLDRTRRLGGRAASFRTLPRFKPDAGASGAAAAPSTPASSPASPAAPSRRSPSPQRSPSPLAAAQGPAPSTPQPASPKMPPAYARRVLNPNLILRDAIEQYARATRSAVRIQSLFRGHSVRRNLNSAQGSRSPVVGKPSSPLAGSRPETPSSVKSDVVKRESAKHALQSMLEVLSHVDKTTHGLKQFPMLLRAQREQLLAPLLDGISGDLTKFAEYLAHTGQRIRDVLHAVLDRPAISRHVQTVMLSTSCAAQTQPEMTEPEPPPPAPAPTKEKKSGKRKS